MTFPDFLCLKLVQVQKAISCHPIIERKGKCKIIAGGTDLIPVLRKEEIHPEYVLNILVEPLRGITETDNVVRIGPTTTFTEMTESEVLNRCLPLLVLAAPWVGGPQIRNRGTIGGNITSASPGADVLPALLALGGDLELRSSTSGTRLLPLTEAIEAPYRTHFQPDEILTGILIRKLPPGTRTGFEKLGRRKALTRARMNMSIILRLDNGGIITELRIAPGAVMPVARRMKNVENILLGNKPGKPLVEVAAQALADEILEVAGVRWSTEYKMPVVKNVFKRVLRQTLTAN